MPSFQVTDFVTIALLVALEGLLSADNAMVLAILVLSLPKSRQRQALRYGIVGAFAFRALATVLAVYLISLGWVKLAGAGYLMYLAVRHFTQPGGEGARRAPPKATGFLGMSPFWTTVMKVELTDIVFAIDSILVAVAMSSKLWVILTGGILGIIMMRLVIGKLLAVVERYPPLVDGAFIIIAWVAVKLFLEYLHVEGYVHFEVPKWLSLGLIVVIFGVSLLYAMREEKKDRLALPLLQGSERPALTFVWRAGWRHRRSIEPFGASNLHLFGRRRRRDVFIQRTGIGPGHVTVCQRLDGDALFAPERTADLQFIAWPHEPIGLRGLTVHLDLPAPACLLCLGPCLEQTRHVEPDIQANGLIFEFDHLVI